MWHNPGKNGKGSCKGDAASMGGCWDASWAWRNRHLDPDSYFNHFGPAFPFEKREEAVELPADPGLVSCESRVSAMSADNPEDPAANDGVTRQSRHPGASAFSTDGCDTEVALPPGLTARNRIIIHTRGEQTPADPANDAAYVQINAKPLYDDSHGMWDPVRFHTGLHNVVLSAIVNHIRLKGILRDVRKHFEEHIGSSSVHFDIFCKHGRHRSVALAIVLKHIFEQEQFTVILIHRDEQSWRCIRKWQQCDECCAGAEEKLRLLQETIPIWRDARPGKKGCGKGKGQNTGKWQ